MLWDVKQPTTNKLSVARNNHCIEQLFFFCFVFFILKRRDGFEKKTNRKTALSLFSSLFQSKIFFLLELDTDFLIVCKLNHFLLSLLLCVVRFINNLIIQLFLYYLFIYLFSPLILFSFFHSVSISFRLFYFIICVFTYLIIVC